MDSQSLFLLLAACVAALVVAARLHYLFWVRRLTLDVEYAERHELSTADGASITLYRLDPPATPEHAPVLLVHGLAANHRNVDPEPDRSLARHLHAEGRDVWLLTLRSGQAPFRRGDRRRVRFGAMVEHDVPEAIDFVLERTRASCVDYVGFSMGGMLLYAALGRTVLPSKIDRVAVIGSPGRVALPFRFLRFFRRLPAFLFPALWLRLGARMSAFIAELFPTPIHRLIYNPANVDRGVASRALVNLIEDVPATLSADFARWALEGGALRVDGEEILEGLADVSVPAAFFAGAADRIAPPEAVLAAHDAWGKNVSGVDKRFVLVGRESGAEHDYGHGDLAVGRDLAKDLFEPLSRWLDGRA